MALATGSLILHLLLDSAPLTTITSGVLRPALCRMSQFKIQQSNTLAPTGVSVMNRRAFVAALKDMQAKIVLSRVSTSELGLNFMFILQQYGPDSNCAMSHVAVQNPASKHTLAPSGAI